MRITRSLKYRPDPSLFADGSVSAPGIAFSSNSTTGIYQQSNSIRFAVAGAITGMFTASGQMAANSIGLDLSNTDTILVRDGAAGTLAQRNGTNAQAFRIYNTYTDASNYERLGLRWASNIGILSTEIAGTGTFRTLSLRGHNALDFSTGASLTTRWQMDGNGHFVASADNTYDIGASGATRPRTIYAATGIVTQHVAAATPTGGTSGEIRVGNSKIWVNDGGTWKSVAVA